MRMRRALPLIAGVLLAGMTGACQLSPLYGDGKNGLVAQRLSGIELAPIDGRAGYFIRQALEQRLGREEAGSPYRLVITLDDDISAFGIRSDSSATRERRTLRARYQLVDRKTGLTLLDQTAGSDAGIDIVSSEYATVAAEQTALEQLAEQVAEQIVLRLAVYARRASSSDTTVAAE